MAYLLDANCFIDPRNNYYPMDICPGYWDWLLQENKAGVLFSIDRIRTELIGAGQDDDVAKWVKARDDTFFLPALTDANVLARVGQIGSWLLTLVPSRYKPHVVAEFMNCADPFLIAYAIEHKHIIITQEVHKPDMRKKVGIPFVCLKYGVDYKQLLELLRLRGARFVL